MKVGDKIYCIKTVIGKNDLISLENINTEGKFYVIDKVSIDNVLVTCDYELSVCEYRLYGTNSYFYDYFVTEKEYRKLKLEKINKINERN